MARQGWTRRRVGRWAVLEVAGEVDFDSSRDLGEEIEELRRSGTRHIIIDLRRLEFIDSSGIHVLVERLSEVEERGGRLALAGVEPRFRRIFEILRLEDRFDFYSSPEEAPD